MADALITERITDFTSVRRRAGAAKETVNNDLIAISSLATLAVRQDWIPNRPDIVKFRSSRRIRHLTPDEVGAYLREARPEFRLFFEVLLETGCRLGQAEALRLTDLRVGPQDAHLILADNKGSERREYPVAILRETAAALSRYAASAGLGPADRLFRHARRTVQKEHTRICERLHLESYTLHDHRHTSAVALAKAGLPIPVLQKRLGHRNFETTMRYADFHPDYAGVEPYLEKTRSALAPFRDAFPEVDTPADGERGDSGPS